MRNSRLAAEKRASVDKGFLTGLGAAMFRVIFHLDMDAFYAAVEQRDDPALRGKPVIVGGPPTQRGVVCAASYEARKFGVRSAMPSGTAGRLCPKGIFVRPRMDRYQEESREIMQIVAASGAVIEQMSIDEAYADVSALCQDEDADASLLLAVPLARDLKQRIKSERQLTATIGIASNKLLAKIASDHQKPDGLTVISDRDKVRFLRPFPVRTLYGVGKVTEQVLNQAGIRTVGDLQDYSGDLRALVGSFGPKLKQFAFGEDDRPLELGDEIKSISGEETFLHDTEDRKILRACLKEQAADIAARLKRRRLGAHTVQVKVRYGDFKTLTRQISVEEPLTEAKDIYRLGCVLLGREKLVSRPLRLLGLGVSNLREPGAQQLPLL
jgi:DNA polymerase-4